MFSKMQPIFAYRKSIFGGKIPEMHFRMAVEET